MGDDEVGLRGLGALVVPEVPHPQTSPRWAPVSVDHMTDFALTAHDSPPAVALAGPNCSLGTP